MTKEFCYMDKDTGDYVSLNVESKENFDSIRAFYETLYSIKTDSTYSCSSVFSEDRHACNLKQCFLNMADTSILSFKEIYRYFDTDEQRMNPRLASIIRKFMDMFSFSEKERYTSEEYGMMARVMSTTNMLDGQKTFKEESDSIFYNTKMMELTGVTPLLSAKTKSVQKVLK